MTNYVSWYIPIKENTEVTGPHSTEDVIKMFKEGEVKADCFVYSSHFKDHRWVRIIDVPEFKFLFNSYPKVEIPAKKSKGITQQKRIVKVDASGEYGIENEYRRYPRAPFAGEVFVHNQLLFSKAIAVDISEKGISISMENKDLFQLGEDVSVTVIGSCLEESFSVKATVMRRLDESFQGLGLYFIMITPVIKRKIAAYVVETLGVKKEINEAS